MTGTAEWTVLVGLMLSLALGHAIYITTLRYNKQLSNTYVLAALAYQLLLGALIVMFVLLKGG